MILLNRRIFLFLFILTVLVINYCNIVKAQIVPNPSYTNVTTNPITGDIEIRSIFPINSGDTILNRFTQFDLAANQTAQMYLGPQPGATTAINVVSNPLSLPSNILGTLNLRLGNTALSPVGGRLIFVDPNGIFVGPLGSINAGGILLSTSKQTLMQLYPTGFIDLNNPAEDSKLASQAINFNGIMTFNQVSGGINILGNLDNRSIDNTTRSSGTYLIASDINIDSSANIRTARGNVVGLIAADNVQLDPNKPVDINYIVKDSSPLASEGNININGTIDCPENKVIVKVNTEDIVNNVVNINGLIDASAIVSGNSSEGKVLIEVINPNIIPGSGGVILDGSGGSLVNPKGQIIAIGNNYGFRGTVEIHAPQLIITNGGRIDVKNGINNKYGGIVSLANNGSYKTLISSTDTEAFTTSETLQSINTADNSLNISAKGVLAIDDNSINYTGIDINDNINMEPKADVIFETTGNINISSSKLTCDNSIIFKGADFNINNSTINSSVGYITIFSNTGNVNINSGSYIISDYSNVNIFRSRLNIILRVSSNGTLSAKNGYINIGNSPGIVNNNPIILSGSTFGKFAGVYDDDDIITLDNSTPKLLASTMNIIYDSSNDQEYNTDTENNYNDNTNEYNDEDYDRLISLAIECSLGYTEACTPEVEAFMNQEDIEEFINNALEDYIDEENFEDDADWDFLAEEFEDFSFDDYDEPFDYFAEGFSDQNLFDATKFCGGDKCQSLLSDNSIGGMFVDALFNGYPPENEYSADDSGVNYAKMAEHNPTGLENFLESIKELERHSNTSGKEHFSINSMFSYRHPPTDTRIKMIEHKLKEKTFDINKYKTNNTKEFEEIINSIENK